MRYRYNGEKYEAILNYKWVINPFKGNHDSTNRRLAKSAENASYRSSSSDVKLFVCLYSSGITEFTIGLRNNLMTSFQISDKPDDIYYNTYRAIGDKIDEFENELTTSAIYIPIALYADHVTGEWMIYVDGKLTDQYIPFAVKTDKYMYPVRNLYLVKGKKNGYVNYIPKICAIDDSSKREDVIESINDFNRQVRQRLHISDSKYLVNTVIVHPKNVNAPNEPFDVFDHYLGDNGSMAYNNLINDACSMGVDKGKNNHTIFIDIINDTDTIVSIDDTIVSILTK